MPEPRQCVICGSAVWRKRYRYYCDCICAREGMFIHMNYQHYGTSTLYKIMTVLIERGRDGAMLNDCQTTRRIRKNGWLVEVVPGLSQITGQGKRAYAHFFGNG